MYFKFLEKDKPEERGCGNFDFLTYNSFGGYSASQALQSSAVYRCVEVLSDSIALLPLEPFKVDSRGYQENKDGSFDEIFGLVIDARALQHRWDGKRVSWDM